MTNPGKVKASAGAEWLLGGFGLLKKEPLALGLVGLVFAIVSVLPLLFAVAGPVVAMLAQLGVVMLTPIMLGGMVHAAREVDEGRGTHPGHLLQGFREGRALALVAQLIPQLAAVLVAILLLAVMIGPAALQQMATAIEQAQGNPNPDPALFQDFPFGALALWLLAVIVIGLVTYTFTFLFPALVMFDRAGPFEAMGRSFRACMANIGAFLVFIMLMIVVTVAIVLGAQIVALVLMIFVGEVAAAVAAQLLMMSVLMPVAMGAVYRAWQQLLGDGADDAAQGHSVTL